VIADAVQTFCYGAICGLVVGAGMVGVILGTLWMKKP